MLKTGDTRSLIGLLSLDLEKYSKRVLQIVTFIWKEGNKNAVFIKIGLDYLSLENSCFQGF